MKVDVVSKNIISNYNTLSQMSAQVPKGNIVSTWGLRYKKDNVEAFISDTGTVQYNASEIQIINGKIEKIKKPLFATWKKVFVNIDKMLKDTIANFDDKNIVKKRRIGFVTFTEEQIAKMSQKLPS